MAPLEVSYNGIPLVRSMEVSFGVRLVEPIGIQEYAEYVRSDLLRETILTLPAGQVWPKSIKAGKPIQLSFRIQGRPSLWKMTGRVRYRRLGKLVVEGALTEVMA